MKQKKARPTINDDDERDFDEDEDNDTSFNKYNKNNESRDGHNKTFVEYDMPNLQELKEGEKAGLILYNYRWVVLFAYFLTSAATGSV